MAEVLATMKIMPESPEVDLEAQNSKIYLKNQLHLV